MMNSKGQTTGEFIIAGVVIAGILLVAICVLVPDVAAKIPGIGDLFVYRADFTVEVSKEALTGVFHVDIKSLHFSKSILSVGPFFYPIGGELQVMSYKDGILIDKKYLDWQWGWFQYSSEHKLSLKLGKPGSGEYLIRAEVYKDGQMRAWVDKTVTVPEQ